MSSRVLRSIDEVIDVLGKGDRFAGRVQLIRLTGRRTQHVTNWRADGRLPKNFWLVLSKALSRRGYRMAPELCGLEPAVRKKAS